MIHVNTDAVCSQVTSLHKGLDRCAALLSDILQAEKRGRIFFHIESKCS